MSLSCPCGSGRPLDSCCRPYLSGQAAPLTAEALMRSRYSAFVEQDWDYLKRTQAEQHDEPPTPDIEWLGLEVLAAHGGGADDTEGTVEFLARYRHQGRPASLHEISRFRKQDGMWLYLDGKFPREERPAKTGRNDPCPCGSGKKYKKCCAHD